MRMRWLENWSRFQYCKQPKKWRQHKNWGQPQKWRQHQKIKKPSEFKMTYHQENSNNWKVGIGSKMNVSPACISEFDLRLWRLLQSGQHRAISASNCSPIFTIIFYVLNLTRWASQIRRGRGDKFGPHRNSAIPTFFLYVIQQKTSQRALEEPQELTLRGSLEKSWSLTRILSQSSLLVVKFWYSCEVVYSIQCT